MNAKTDSSVVPPADELASQVRGDVLSDHLHCVLYATDASPYQIQPQMVVLPRDADDVSATVRFAAGRGMPVAARGSGSGLAGECLSHGIVIDFTRYMSSVVRVDAAGSSAQVEAGCVFQTLNDELAGCGKQFGPDPASGNRATIGGMIANNSTGAHSLRYGHTGDHVTWLDTVLADGSQARFWSDGRAEAHTGQSPLLHRIRTEIPRLLTEWADRIEKHWPTVDRNRAGYRLKDILSHGKVAWTQLLAGSEGTLAVWTAAELHLVDAPRITLMVQANFGSLDEMADALPAIVAKDVATCELMDGTLLRLAREAYPERADLLPEAAATLLIGIEEMAQEAADERLAEVLEVLHGQAGLAGEPVAIRDAERREALMDIRKKAIPLLYRRRGGPQALPVIEDVCVGAEGMPKYIRGLQAIAKEEGIQLVYYAHAGHGEPHVRPFLDLHTPVDRAKFQRLARRAYEVAWSIGGSISGEHACGLVRSGFLSEQYGQMYELMRRVKEVFDPDNVLNPGKVITDQPGEELMIQELRYKNENRPELAEDTLLHWDPDELIHEMEACNGCAVCRSLVTSQTMCPMYRAKLVEAASPRAKANLMRNLITGVLDESYRTREAFRAIADNCVNCKSCVRECPSAVNIPKLMGEIKARYARDVGMRRVERVLAGGEKMSRMGSRFGPMANATMSLGATRWVLEKLTGIDRRRPMPKFAWGNGAKKLRKYLRKRGQAPFRAKHRDGPPGEKEPVPFSADRVVYFIDLVACYNDHALGRAAVDVLRHNGVDVVVPPQKSAAMPPIDYGDLDGARAVIRYNIENLLPHVREGRKIVTSEPTAALCLKEEWLEIEHTDEAKEIAQASWELMHFLLDLYRQGRLKTDFRPLNVLLAYHGPCHLKALGSGAPGVELVRMIPEAKVDVIDLGCCGIAGTFGFQKRNFELSLKAGSAMLEALKEHPAPYGLSECGTCKMQMEYASGKYTFHPIKLLAMAYGYEVGNCPAPPGRSPATPRRSPEVASDG